MQCLRNTVKANTGFLAQHGMLPYKKCSNRVMTAVRRIILPLSIFLLPNTNIFWLEQISGCFLLSLREFSIFHFLHYIFLTASRACHVDLHGSFVAFVYLNIYTHTQRYLKRGRCTHRHSFHLVTTCYSFFPHVVSNY